MATFRNITCDSAAGIGTVLWPTSSLILPATLEVTGQYCNITPSINVNIGPAGAVDITSGTPGTMDNVAIGGTTALAGTFTTLVAKSATSLLLGTAGTAVGSVGFRNATSGTITIAPPTGALGTVTLTLPSATASDTLGYLGVPQNVQSGDYTLVLSDAGKSIDKQSGGSGETITIPANSSVAFPIGTVICGDNDGGGTLTIAITSDTLELAGTGSTGSRTVADNGHWVIRKIASTKWRISGTGIS